jgi:hypothetical protein
MDCLQTMQRLHAQWCCCTTNVQVAAARAVAMLVILLLALTLQIGQVNFRAA